MPDLAVKRATGDTIRVKPGLAGQGFDLWIDGKKLTRGRKYLVAKNINHAIANILTGNDYKDAFKAEILR